MGVSELLFRNDLDYERYDTVSPDGCGRWSTRCRWVSAAGSRSVRPTRPREPSDLGPVARGRAGSGSAVLVEALPVSGTVVLDGDGDGIVDAAAAGAVDGRAPVLYAATTSETQRSCGESCDGARIVLTDTNRRRVRRWRTIIDTTGITLRADQDPADADGGLGGEAPSTCSPTRAPTGRRSCAKRGAGLGDPLRRTRAVSRTAIDLRPWSMAASTTAWQVGPTIGGIGRPARRRPRTAGRTDHMTISTTPTTARSPRSTFASTTDPLRVNLDPARSRAPRGRR